MEEKRIAVEEVEKTKKKPIFVVVIAICALLVATAVYFLITGLFPSREEQFERLGNYIARNGDLSSDGISVMTAIVADDGYVWVALQDGLPEGAATAMALLSENREKIVVSFVVDTGLAANEEDYGLIYTSTYSLNAETTFTFKSDMLVIGEDDAKKYGVKRYKDSDFIFAEAIWVDGSINALTGEILTYDFETVNCTFSEYDSLIEDMHMEAKAFLEHIIDEAGQGISFEDMFG